MNIVILGAGTAGLVTALMVREKYPASTITIIKSGEIGTVGVGEGSTEHWEWFMNFVGIDHLELIHETKATVKIGILFKDWHTGSDYVHSIFDFNLSALNRPDFLHHLYLNGENKQFPLTPHFETIFSKNLVNYNDKFKPSNQYHFDTFKLGEYLSKICKQNDIIIKDGIVTDVVLSSDGNVTKLVTNSEDIEGELFIDCSGFKRVISSKIGNKWVSKTDYLPLNRAIAFPTAHTDPDNLEPYTTATALSSGWSWRIPTQERYGNGYVFNTTYIDSDKALNEISQTLGIKVEKFARDIPFEAGKVEKFWLKNVISVGLSGSFAEPLEAQSIGFTIVQAQTMLNFLDAWQINKNVSDQFNVIMDGIFDNIIDYLQLHYLGDRNDTKFWQDKPFTLTEFNKENLPLFKRGIFLTTNFKDDYMFKVGNFYQVSAGLNLIDKELVNKSLESNRYLYNKKYYDNSVAVWDNIKTRLVIKHSEYLKQVSLNYLHRKNLNEN